MHGVATACDTILGHVQRGSRVAVFGDYDVDGVCSTAITVRCLRALGADPLWQLPSRDEGYGLWLDPAIQDDPVYAEHWAGHRPVTVTVEAERIVISRAGEESDGDDDDE